jgi:hypothetical protein
VIAPDGSLPGFPGRRFAPARWSFPYRGVVAQYREVTRRSSMHVLVRRDGSTEHHVDKFNPDLGHPIRHFLIDTPVGRGAALLCCCAVAARVIG